jgi:hypothetical protein
MSGANPPLGFPKTIDISKVAPGHAGSGSGGNVIHVDGKMGASITGDAFGVFSVASMETLQLMRDPDAPGNRRVWETTGTVNGAGPIDVGAGDAIAVTANFVCPIINPQASYHAVIAVGPTGQPAALTILLSGSIDPGTLSIVATATPPLVPGGQAVFHFRLNSTLLREIAGVFTCDPAPGDDSPFRSDTAPSFRRSPPAVRSSLIFPSPAHQTHRRATTTFCLA